MDSFWLTFAHKPLETDYQRHALATRLWHIDSLFLGTSALLGSSRAIRILLGDSVNQPATDFMPVLLNSALAVGLLLMRERLGVDGMQKRRTVLVVLFRIIMTFCFVLHVPQMELTPHARYNTLENMVTGYMGSVVMGPILLALGMRLSFRINLYTCLFTTLMLLFGKSQVFCAYVERSPSKEVFLSAESFVDRVAGRLMDAMYNRFGFVNFILTRPKEPCLHMTSFTYIFVAFGLVSYLVWMSERSARVRYIKSMQEAEDNPHLPKIAPIPCAMFLHHAFIIVIMFAVCWEFFVFVPTYVKTYGPSVELVYSIGKQITEVGLRLYSIMSKSLLEFRA